MSTLFDLRKSYQAALVASGLWNEEAIIIKRQTDIWNDIAFAMEATKNGCVLVIGVAAGRKNKGQGSGNGKLDLQLTMPFTIFCAPVIDESDENAPPPEEDIWENTIGFLDGYAGNDPSGRRKHSMYELSFEDFSDDVEIADGQPHYLARQSVFSVKHIIPKFTPPTP